MVEGLLIPVIPRAKLFGVPTPLGPLTAVRLKRKDQTECNQPPEDPKDRMYMISTVKLTEDAGLLWLA